MIQFSLVCLYSFLFILLIYKLPFFKTEGISSKTISFIFIFKIIIGFILYLIYTLYYPDRSTADIFRYFDDSKFMFNAIFTNPKYYFQMLLGINDNNAEIINYYKQMNNWYRQYESIIYNDNHLVIRLNAFLRIFSFGYYNVHSVFMNFISLIGLLSIYKAFSSFLKSNSIYLIVAVFLMPSVLFWSSGVLKEGLMLFFLGVLILNYFKMFYEKPNYKAIAYFLTSLFFLLFLKIYVLIALIPGMIAYFWVEKTKNKNILFKYFAVISILFICAIFLEYILPQINPFQLLANKQDNFLGLSKYMNSGSIIYIPILKPNVFSLLKISPIAFINTFFRPHIFEAKSLMILLAALENLIIICFLILSIIFFDKKNINLNFLLFSTTFVLILFVLIGLIVPVMGAIVRYKVPALPFLICIFIILIDKEKVNLIFNKFKRNV